MTLKTFVELNSKIEKIDFLYNQVIKRAVRYIARIKFDVGCCKFVGSS